MVCNNCGKEIKDNSKFCTSCGTRVETIKANSENTNKPDSYTPHGTQICKKCGRENLEGKKFCTSCGNPFIQQDDTMQMPVVKPKPVPKSSKKKSKNIIFIIIAVVLLVAIVGASFLITSLMETKELKDALESKDPYRIESVYRAGFGDAGKIDKYDKVIEDFLNEVYKELNEHDFYDEAVNDDTNAVEYFLESQWGELIAHYGLQGCITASTQDEWDKLFELIDSKEAYCEGVYCYEHGEYDDAIGIWSYVIQDDSLKDDVSTLIEDGLDDYINSVLEEVDKYIVEEDISGAVNILSIAKETLKESGINSEELQGKIDETLTSYAEGYARKAEEAFNNKDINAAIGNIEVALELQPENSDYKATNEKYQQYLPFELYKEENILIGDIYLEDIVVSNTNEDYTNVFGVYCDNSENELVFDLTYNLSGKYDEVTGKMFISEHEKNENIEGYFEAYGDGKLIYTSPTLVMGSLPENIDFNVSNIQKLVLKFYGKSKHNLFGMDFGTEYCISNLVAQKNFPES